MNWLNRVKLNGITVLALVNILEENIEQFTGFPGIATIFAQMIFGFILKNSRLQYIVT